MTIEEARLNRMSCVVPRGRYTNSGNPPGNGRRARISPNSGSCSSASARSRISFLRDFPSS